MLNKNHMKSSKVIGLKKQQTRKYYPSPKPESKKMDNIEPAGTRGAKPEFKHEGGLMRRNIKNIFQKSEGFVEKSFYIYGKHAVMSALKNKIDCVESIFISGEVAEEKNWKDIISEVKSRNTEITNTYRKIEVHTFEEKTLPRELLREIDDFATHQGCMAKINSERLIVDGKKFLENFKVEKTSCFVVLGEIKDIQNVGSIIRSAAGMNVDGIFVPEHNQAPINGNVVKISAGNAFSVPLLSIGNVNNTLKDLKEKGFWIYGLEMGGKSIYEEKFTEATVIVVGNESTGIREKTKENCDILISIPIDAKCESLNAAVSTAIALSEIRRQNIVI
jgi:23S rRNA (guanosine2251-2'-O)-methyltransferase